MSANVFKDGDGNRICQSINQTDVATTVQWLEELTGLDFHTELADDGKPAAWIGSTGRKPTSGDLDLAVDANTVDKSEFVQRLESWAKSHKLDPKDWIRKTGMSVHLKTPINGRPDQGFVQTDFMFLPNPPWARWALRAGGDTQYRGSDRNVLMNSIAKSLGWKLHQGLGIVDRTTNQVITDDPDRAAKLLLNNRATKEDLATVESILAALENDRERDAKLATAREHFQQQGVPFVENVELDNEVNWLARLRDRIVNQGMWVLIEDQQIKESPNIGGRDKGIPHIEDLVFRKGIRGVDEAKKILQAAAADTPGTTTAKWDGRPAIIFGRDPESGDFVLTDTAGFHARGHDGMFTSANQLIRDLQRRDNAAQERGKSADRMQQLAPMYAGLWPKLEAAWPKTLRGFVHGDLLYTPENPWHEQEGNAVFQPNEVLYRIPMSSDLGQRIANSDTGIAVHTKYSDRGSAKQPVGDIKFRKVPGLLIELPVTANSVKLDRALLSQINQTSRAHASAINQLFNPVDLRGQKITNLPALCVDYINSRVGSGFDNLAQGFMTWLPDHVTPSKMQNILSYLESPASNQPALEAAFELWSLLHELKMDVLHQLDLQHPGQEGWVMATPHGYAKAVSRMPGGFAARNRARNNP